MKFSEVKTRLQKENRLNGNNGTDAAKKIVSIDGVWLDDGVIEVDTVGLGFQAPGSFFDSVVVENTFEIVKADTDDEAEAELEAIAKEKYPDCDEVLISVI